MKICHSISEISSIISQNKIEGKLIGFIPTMGALHEGHLELVKKAKSDKAISVVSIFVNPLQFNNKEDLLRYPKQENEDMELLNSIGCDVVFIPDELEIYTDEFNKSFESILDETHVSALFEGQYRPGHFKGVAKVLYRFFSILKPDLVYFGLKDYQQCLLVKQITEKHFPEIKPVFVPTVRMISGLAMSSRNERLSEKGKIKASFIYAAMVQVLQHYSFLSPEACRDKGMQVLNNQQIEIDYFEICEADTLNIPEKWNSDTKYIILAAVYIEKVRLIDNLYIN